jgi:glycosyltransferase involved in cell wall biosynthesis
MLAGLPIIASDIPENRECVTEEMAIFHKVGDSADLTRSMLKAIQQSDWAERTSKAHHHATEVFDVDKIAALYESFYERTIHSFKRQHIQ